jgi:putative membrane protein
MNQPTLRTVPLVIALAFGSGWAAAQTASAPASNSATQQQAGKGDKLSHADKSFIEDAAKGGMFEVQSGKVAEQKASDPQVKEFAQRLVQDHSKANDELMQIAQAKGVKMPDKDKWADKHELNKLNKMSGADFDREFAQHSVKDHQKDIQKFEKASAKLKDPEVKAWAEKQLPVLREHLAMAQKLQGSGQAASTGHSAGKKSSS